MKDIYGEDYLIISRHDYDRMLDRIKKLEKIEKEYREYLDKIAFECIKSSNETMRDAIELLLHNKINSK